MNWMIFFICLVFFLTGIVISCPIAYFVGRLKGYEDYELYGEELTFVATQEARRQTHD